MNNDRHDIVTLLGGLGIGRNEAVTYAALLKIDSVSIRKIAVSTGINRGTTYDALKKLVTIGLVSVKRHGTREHYTAEPPEKIFDIIKDKRHELLSTTIAAKEIVPELAALKANPTGGQPLVRFYENDEGVVAILKDVLQTCRTLSKPEYYAYSSGPIRKYLYRKFPQFTNRRIDENIHVKVIAMGEGGEITENSERRWIRDETSGSDFSYMIIYGNKVGIISITDEKVPYGVVIEDVGGASMQRLLFNQLWNYLGKH
jgi:sugar-specific transcriptional regulator TrmB